MRRLVSFLVAFVIGGAAVAQSGPIDAAAMFDRANSAFRQGLEVAQARPDVARGRFAEAAAAYETIASRVRNEKLCVNLGNAYLLAGDTGRAVLQFRRALRLAPGDAGASAGLKAARARVGPAVPRHGASVPEWLSAWRRVVPAPSVWALCAVAWCAGWALRAAGAQRPRLLAALWFAGALGGALHIAERWVDRRSNDAVVIQEGTAGLNGPASGIYQPTFDKPLPAGAEVRTLESRAGWTRVVLPDGRETWLPDSALERV